MVKVCQDNKIPLIAGDIGAQHYVIPLGATHEYAGRLSRALPLQSWKQSLQALTVLDGKNNKGRTRIHL